MFRGKLLCALRGFDSDCRRASAAGPSANNGSQKTNVALWAAYRPNAPIQLCDYDIVAMLLFGMIVNIE